MKQKNPADTKKAKTNWFYSETVKEHFFNPRNICKTEKELEEFKKEANGYGIAGSPVCGDQMEFLIKVDSATDRIKECRWRTFGSLLPGAEILMSNFSIKKVEELSIGDSVLDGDGKENFIEEILIRDYLGKVIDLRLSTSKFYNFTLTPNHPVPAIKRKKVALVLRHSGERWSEVSQEKINTSQIELVPAAELEPGDFLLFQVSSKIEDNNLLDRDICTLLGYYVSDGSIPSKNLVIFYFGLHESKYTEEIIEIAERRNWKYLSYKRNTENVICVQLNEPKIVDILRMHGGKPSKKNFSQEVLFLPPLKQELIIDAYINGDGWTLQQDINWEPTYFISTHQDNLAYQLQFLLGRCGIFAPIHKREKREFIIRGKRYTNSGEINLIFRKQVQYSRIRKKNEGEYFLIPLSSIKTRDYAGKIFDPGLVDEPKTYRVRGISFHNCASALASTSVLSEMITEKGGMKISQAVKLTPQDIIKRLHGLPAIKVHCSVLGDQALRAAIKDYLKRQGRESQYSYK